jgi:hypothetical protein
MILSHLVIAKALANMYIFHAWRFGYRIRLGNRKIGLLHPIIWLNCNANYAKRLFLTVWPSKKALKHCYNLKSLRVLIWSLRRLRPIKNKVKLSLFWHPEINDITISRIHCSINFENNQFVLKDEGSKFGTFVLLEKPVRI